MSVHSLYTAAAGMDAQLKNIDVIANNIANINNAGFRKDRINFADLFYRQQAIAGSTGTGDNPRPSGINIGHGVRVVSTEKMFKTMAPIMTDKPTDVAIQGPGNVFFQIEMPSGELAYTRAGNFTLNDQGRMVTPSGNPVAGVGPAPQQSTIQVMSTGQVLARIGSENQAQEIGRIALTRFINPAGLTPGGDNLFFATAAAGEPETVDPAQWDSIRLLGGAIEGSNVSPIEELVKLIQGQRAYEINSNVVKTADEALQIANNLRN